jgi:hypothetical protein
VERRQSSIDRSQICLRIEPVSGHLRGSVLDLWPKYFPLVQAERRKREASGTVEAARWQVYFELL